MGFVLLATVRTTGLPPALAGGLLAAALTAPHVLGPLSARFLDRASDPRRVLAAAAILYAAFVATAALTLGAVPIALSIVLVAIAGFCGPLLTGGLSSTLASLVAPDERPQRRAQGWDALTYGIGGTLGPAVVALVASLADPLVAVVALSGAAIASAGLTVFLPRLPSARGSIDDGSRSRGVIRALVRVGPLRRATVLTMAAAVPGGAVAVIAVAFSRQTVGDPAQGGLLVAAFGVGNLIGAVILTVLPLRGGAERNLELFTLLVAAAFAGCSLATSFVALMIMLAVAGGLNAPYFAATLAVRSEFSPPALRGQTFTAMAGFKTAAGSAGSAAAGVTIGLGSPLLFFCGAALVAIVLLAAHIDHTIAIRRHKTLGMTQRSRA